MYYYKETSTKSTVYTLIFAGIYFPKFCEVVSFCENIAVPLLHPSPHQLAPYLLTRCPSNILNFPKHTILLTHFSPHHPTHLRTYPLPHPLCPPLHRHWLLCRPSLLPSTAAAEGGVCGMTTLTDLCNRTQLVHWKALLGQCSTLFGLGTPNGT